MALQEENAYVITEETDENTITPPVVLPEKRPPEVDKAVDTTAKVEKEMEKSVVPSGAVKPEIMGKKPLKKAIAQDVVKQQEQKSVPSINDFVAGKTFMLGENEVDPDLVAKVRSGDKDAFLELGEQIDDYATSVSGPVIPSVRFDETGKGKVVEISDDPVIQKELSRYGQARLDLYNRLKGTGLKDENALKALTKYYSTGDFLAEGGRRITQAGTLLAQAPFGAFVLGKYLSGSIYESVSSFWDDNAEGNPIEFFKKKLPQIGQEFNSYRSFIEDDLKLKGVTYGSLVDSKIKEKIKQDIGEERFKAQYTVKSPITGETSEIRLITDEMGQELLDVGFKELPFSEKFLLFGLENMTITSGLAKQTVKKGNQQLARVQKARKDNPNDFQDWDDVQVIRYLEIEDKKNALSKGLRSLTAKIGTKFKNRGAMGSAEFNHRHATRITSIDKQIDRLEVERATANEARKKIIDGQVENLQTQRSRVLFGSGKALFNMNNRFLFQTQKDELLITFAQAAGNHNAEYFGLSSGTGEMIGAFGMAFKLPQTILTSKPVTVTSNVLTLGLAKAFYTTGKDIAGFTGKVLEKLPPIPKGFFADRRLDNIEQELKRPLNASEREGLDYMQKAILDLDPVDREKIFDNVREYQDLRNRIVGHFDGNPELQEQAREAFNLSFAHVSGLAPLIALRNRATGKINAKNPDLKEPMFFQVEAENGRMAAGVAFKRLEELLNKQGAGIKDNKYLQNFVTGFKRADAQLRDQLNQDRIMYNSLLDKYVRSFGGYESEMDATELDTLVDLEIGLNRGDVNNLTTRRESLQKLSMGVYEGLNERLKNVKKLRGTRAYRKKLSRIVEEVYDFQISKQYADGRIGYQKAEQYAKENNKEYAIGDLVENMISKGEALEPRALAKFFSAEGKFFFGRSGRMARNAFNEMAKRSIRNDLQLDENEIAELLVYHRNKGSEATGDFVGENADFVDIMLHLSKKEGSTLLPFKATPFELEEVRRHFDRVGESTKEREVGEKFTNFADSIDDKLQEDKVMYSLIQEARGTYKDRVFDTRRKGSSGEEVDNARTGPAYTVKDENGLSYPYKKGQTPDNFHSNIGKNIQNIIDNKSKAIDDLDEEIDSIQRFWGDNVDGEIAFDVSTEQGLLKYNLVSQLIEANIYEHWGALKETTLGNIKARAEGFGKLPTAKYNFADADRFEEVSDTLKVKLWDGEKFSTRSLFDPTEMFKIEKDITEIIKLDNNVAKQHNQLIQEVNGTSGQLKERANFLNKEKEKFNEDLKQIASIKSADQFFDQYIANGTVGSVAGVKQQYINARTSKDVADKVTETVAEEEFDRNMKSVIAKGLLTRAKMERSERISFQDITTGTEKNATVMSDTGQFSEDMFNENITSIMEEYIDREHVDFLKDLALYFEFSQGTSLAKKYVPEGTIRKVSPNELISRAFNLARGMVSPTYVAAELGVRVSMNHDVEVLELALTNKSVARVLNDVLITNNPEPEDIKNLGVLLKSHIANKLAQDGALAAEYFPQDGIEAVKFEKVLGKDNQENKEKTDENVQ